MRVIQAENEEAARARLIAAGLEPLSIEPVGPSLFDGIGNWRLPRWRPPAIAVPTRPVAIALGLLAMTPVAVAIGAWSLAVVAEGEARGIEARATPTGRADQPYLSHAARPHLAASLSRPTVGDLIRRLSAVLPQGVSLAALAVDAQGRLTMAIDTPDPDRLRLALAGDPLFASLPETGQHRTDDGTIRVTLQGKMR